jgi:hypothetical protein
MAFEQDLLISYAHIDDQSLVDGERGWVSRLHRLLEIRVGQLRGETPRIWRDPKLQGNDVFADAILERLPKVAALLSVVSPRYVQSEWCNRELHEFCLAAETTGGVRVADKTRIFKVVKTPVPVERQPEEFQPMLGYEFFVHDERGRARELAQEYGPEADRAFLAKLDDLAYDIVQLLEMLRGGAASPASQPAKGTVFLAETTFDMGEERDAIKRDLVHNGYEVLPDRALPLVAAELDAVVREQLGRCKLSIHLIGRNYGVIPEGATESIVERQQTAASQLAGVNGLSSVIWLPPGLEVTDSRQQELLQRLQTDPEVHAAAELLQVPIGDLKTLIHRKLAPPPAPLKSAVPSAARELTRIYLLCDQQDLDATRPLEHEENLTSCDALLLYYGAGGELWLRRKLRELQKAAALGREKRLLARAIYVGPPATPQKERFRTLEAMLLREPDGGFARSALEPFVAEIAKARG